MNNHQNDWPPPYTITLSQKSKRISLRITAHKGLEIIVPKRTSLKKAIDFLNLKYDWVQKHHYLLLKKDELSTLPDKLHLQAIEEVWNLKYGQKRSTKRMLSSEATQTILIRDEKSSISSSLLKEWLRKKAKQHLPLLLNHYSQNYCLPYERLSIRYQNSRWGSCSKDKHISLNSKLLLLPSKFVHYVMVHELVHTIHFDHSKSFWEAVEQIIPNQSLIRSELKSIEKQLPNWLY
jgi:predicted metal-dependent hydrolase